MYFWYWSLILLAPALILGIYDPRVASPVRRERGWSLIRPV